MTGADALDPRTGEARALITAAEAYPALEELVLDARHEVALGFRVLDPATRLRSDRARSRGLDTWGDLLSDACARGLNVLVLMADFDPLFTTDLHREAWANARAFASADNRISIRLAVHGACLGSLWKLAFWPRLRSRRADLLAAPERADTPPLKAVLAGDIRLRPVTLHQKLAVADGESCILGGLDVDERRWDDQSHDRPAPQTWHDVSLAVTGPAARAVHAHFCQGWKLAAEDGAAVFGPAAEPSLPRVPDEADGGRVSLLRTVSRPRRGPTAFAPRTVTGEIESAHRAAFSGARRFVYIETQFFRHLPLARALAEAGREAQGLEVVMVLPTEPERIVFGGDCGLDARHAQALQLRCLNLLQATFGERLALISPAKPEPAGPGEGPPLAGAGIVYVHAKVTVVDDETAIVGSANLNGRSMRWDTEAALQLRDPAFARGLRLRLTRHWLGPASEGTATDRAGTWTRAARRNAAAPPEERRGFAMPHPVARNRRFSAYAPFLPADMF